MKAQEIKLEIKLETGKYFLAKNQKVYKIGELSSTGNYYCSTSDNESTGYWSAAGIQNTSISKFTFIKEILKEQNPEYFL